MSVILKQPLILTERDSIYRKELEEKLALSDIELTPFLECGQHVDNNEAYKKGTGHFVPS